MYGVVYLASSGIYKLLPYKFTRMPFFSWRDEKKQVPKEKYMISRDLKPNLYNPFMAEDLRILEDPTHVKKLSAPEIVFLVVHH